MNKNIENYIEHAMQLLQEEENELSKQNKKLDKEYKGYISSLGPSLNMSGLIPTLAFYTSKENNAKADRSKILLWVHQILKKVNAFPSSKETTLLELALNLDTPKRNELERKILDISVALKLSLRTFELTD